MINLSEDIGEARRSGTREQKRKEIEMVWWLKYSDFLE
jgi:hypothetical protein